MSPSLRRRCAGTLLAVAGVVTLTLATPSTVVAAPPGPASASQGKTVAAGPLDLGPADLPETRTTTTLQPGVTLTQIARGAPDPSLTWTLELRIPATSSSPDPLAPPRVLSDEASAQALAERLRTKGYQPRVEAVAQPRAVDVPAGTLGYRVRVGAYRRRQQPMPPGPSWLRQARLPAPSSPAGTATAPPGPVEREGGHDRPPPVPRHPRRLLRPESAGSGDHLRVGTRRGRDPRRQRRLLRLRPRLRRPR
ncbi:MAG: SPOR domain-containing protein [Mycobacteriales bacterium]